MDQELVLKYFDFLVDMSDDILYKMGDEYYKEIDEDVENLRKELKKFKEQIKGSNIRTHDEKKTLEELLAPVEIKVPDNYEDPDQFQTNAGTIVMAILSIFGRGGGMMNKEGNRKKANKYKAMMFDFKVTIRRIGAKLKGEDITDIKTMKEKDAR